MTIIGGRAMSSDLITILNDALIAEGYEMISSNVGSDGRVYKSTGINGKELWYFRIFEDPVSTASIKGGVYDSYTPGVGGQAGVFSSNKAEDWIASWSSTIANAPIVYFINVTKDRLILHVSGTTGVTGRRSMTAYIGAPTRYDPLDRGVGIASSGWSLAGASSMTMLRGKSQVASVYNVAGYFADSSLGWGKQFFLSPLYVGRDADEGMRGELSSILWMKKPDPAIIDCKPYDMFSKNGKTYIILPGSGTTAGIPDGYYGVEAKGDFNNGILQW